MTVFDLGGVTFRQSVTSSDARGVSRPDEFLLLKTDAMLAFYQRLAGTRPRTVMEVGMYEGGSLVYFDTLFKPERVVGLDLRREPIPALEAYRASRPHVVTYYGRSQDRDGTLMAARANFPKGIDLVVDDASHLYAQTRATFSMLFPMVTPGGHYVIEDWAWSHMPSRQAPGATWSQQPALTNLIFELTVLAATSPAVESVEVNRSLVCIRRGPGPFRPKMLDLSGALRGRPLPQI